MKWAGLSGFGGFELNFISCGNTMAISLKPDVPIVLMTGLVGSVKEPDVFHAVIGKSFRVSSEKARSPPPAR